MQPQYLARLGEPLRDFVRAVEQCSAIDLQVVLDYRLNEGGAHGQSNLGVVI